MCRFLAMCTLLADALGLGASYAAGARLFPALGSILPGWLSWLRDVCIHLYQAPFLWMSLIPHLPRAVPLALLRHPGLTWGLAYLCAPSGTSSGIFCGALVKQTWPDRSPVRQGDGAGKPCSGVTRITGKPCSASGLKSPSKRPRPSVSSRERTMEMRAQNWDGAGACW